jgi:hypothetical protein
MHFQVILQNLLGFKILKAAIMNMTVLSVAAPCSLVQVYRRFRDNCSFVAVTLEIWSTSETSVYF